jgi:CheY-like chemotaxis protein
MVVDDSQTIRQIITNELRKMGFEERNITGMSDGQQAQTHLKTEKADLIISDWNMPKMSGLELLKVVKSSPDLKDIPFLMITSESEENKITQAFESGADQYVTKPFKPQLFTETVDKLMLTSKEYGDKKVMVIDDSKPMRQIIINNLAQAGFDKKNISQAEDGEDALAQLLADEKLDLIITDWHMPKMSGLELLEALKASNDTKNIPVLMVTSEVEKEKVMEAIQKGARHYILKPFNAIDLQSKVKAIF